MGSGTKNELQELAEIQRKIEASAKEQHIDKRTPKSANFGKVAERILIHSKEHGEEDDSKRAEEERNKEARKLHDRLDSWNRERGKRYEGCRLSNFQHNGNGDSRYGTLAKLQDYCDRIQANIDAGTGVVLFGTSGTGKDHLAAAIGRAAILAGYSVTWANGVDFFADLRDAMKHDQPEGNVIASLANPALLILSDPLPPKGTTTEYQGASLFRVIDKRYNNCRPTIVTINCANRNEAEERLGPQIIDRLSHDSLVIHCDWPSYRKPKT